MFKWIVTFTLAVLAPVIIYVSILYIYATKYVQDTTTTATTGIVFKKTLSLSEHKHIASGNDLLGKYSLYSRSANQNEVIVVYCKEFCSVKD